MVHIALHFIVPLVYSLLFFRDRLLRTWLILSATMLVDLDHLLADPIYDPNRCSIGFHPLHSYVAIVIYVLLLLPRKTRLVATGLIIHMALDYLDCFI
ncbi:DUF6122 family protein [Polluticoccus soli]|uniref:DUF6122 family protein n=1 Tax=Polluticoccus soli TaxID=3034150 RepID=UPI0023E1EECB|nr:DUF6122 family protein [Flavipsychrobacter sp. JY13-12]